MHEGLVPVVLTAIADPAGLPVLTMIALLLAVFVVAVLYSSVGHAGASGYIAVMSLAGITAAELKPTALVLNLLVASIASWQFIRAGHFSWPMFWPFAATGVPMGFVGGLIKLPVRPFQMLVGLVLIFSAVWFLARPREREATRLPPFWKALLVGAGIGLLAGLTGTGGGIFLTPVLLLAGWARARPAAAASALFILVVSLSGLLGQLAGGASVPGLVVPLSFSVIVGGALGSWLGSRRLDPAMIKRLLAAVLAIAGLKLLLVG